MSISYRSLRKGSGISFAGLVVAVFGLMMSGPVVSSAIAQEEASGPMTIGQHARAYRIYRRDVDDLSRLSFTSINEVRELRDLAMSYDPDELSRGWIAHNAIVASRAPGFMEAVRDEAQARGQAAFFSQSRTSPEFMWSLSSETAAINFVFDGLYQDNSEALAVGRILRDRAIAYMETGYGPSVPYGAAEDAEEILRANVAPPPGRRQYTVAYASKGVMAQVLELAARLSLDRTSGRGSDASMFLLEHADTSRCIRWAQMNLNQCLAATRNDAEEAYCTGRHAVDEVSECWGWMVDLAGTSDHASLAR